MTENLGNVEGQTQISEPWLRGAHSETIKFAGDGHRYFSETGAMRARTD